MTLILDGYNVLHGSPQFDLDDPETLRSAREKLIAMAVAYAQKKKGVSVIIVFDGREGIDWPEESMVPNVKVLFSKKENADEKIIDLIEGGKSLRSVFVATDDRALKYRSKALGAHGLSVVEIMKRFALEKTSVRGIKKVQNPSDPVEKKIHPDEREEINREFRKLWGTE